MSELRLQPSGWPLAVLSNSHAYVHHGPMRAWLRVADDSAPASQLRSSYVASSGAWERNGGGGG